MVGRCHTRKPSLCHDTGCCMVVVVLCLPSLFITSLTRERRAELEAEPLRTTNKHPFFEVRLPSGVAVGTNG
jgi:hypothetical protein